MRIINGYMVEVSAHMLFAEGVTIINNTENYNFYTNEELSEVLEELGFEKKVR